MSGKPVFAAALGALIALAPLLTCAPGAWADEWSDLRTNNELLQQRLDQLGQTPNNPDLAPDSPLARGSFPHSFLIPGTDTSIRVGGSVTGVAQYGRQ
jgi:hypothetical protein